MTSLPETRERAGERAALLDIGGDIGALVVRLGAVPPSGELEACPAGRPDDRFHTGVHLRPHGGSEVPLAIFPAVEAGDYDLLDEDGRPLATVRVDGGAVTHITLDGAGVAIPR